jgi:hypothetical protein
LESDTSYDRWRFFLTVMQLHVCDPFVSLVDFIHKSWVMLVVLYIVKVKALMDNINDIYTYD